MGFGLTPVSEVLDRSGQLGLGVRERDDGYRRTLPTEQAEGAVATLARDDLEAALPLSNYNRLEQAKEGVAALLKSRKYLLSLFDFELFTLEQMFRETEREQSLESATRTLEYARELLAKMDATPRPQ